jgi:outer membrane protein TolC
MTNGATHDCRFRIACIVVAAAMMTIGVPTAGRAQSNDDVLRISPDAAVSLAFANNLELESARRSPEIADLDVRAAEGVWRPFVGATLGQGRTDSPASSSFDQALGVLTDSEVSSEVTMSQRLPWGTSYELGWSSLRRSSNSLLNRYEPELNTTATARVTQPLLRGLSIDAARADRARSRQGRDRAGYAFDGTRSALKREVLYAYWQWVYARELRDVAKEALGLARDLLDGNRQRVAARAMAATDVIEAEAEVARRDEAVIVAEKDVAVSEDRLRLLIMNPQNAQYHAPLEPTDVADPDAAAGGDPVARALATRSDIRILKSAIDTSAVYIRQRLNEALPDVSVSAAFSAQAAGGTELLRAGGIGSPVTGALEHGFGRVLEDLGQLRYPGWSTQLSVGYPIGAAVARANAARAEVERRQHELSLAALEQRVEIEVRTAQREVQTNEKRLESTATAVSLAERRLSGEQEKFLVGLSTSFFVFQAQRDLASARVARLGAELDRRLSLADLEAIQSVPLTPIR